MDDTYNTETEAQSKYVEFDIGALMVCDNNPLDRKQLDSPNCESYLQDLTCCNLQLLFNNIFSLETIQLEDIMVVKLPKQCFRLPRAKPVPQAKALTKWEKFAKEKGIAKKKDRKKLNWDEQLKKWVPLYGFKRRQADAEKNWVIEVPDNQPDVDQYAKSREIREENIAKNELQRLRNIAKAKNVKIPRMGLFPQEHASAQQLGAALQIAKASTASLGRFQQKLPKEKPKKGNIQKLMPHTKKSKAPPKNVLDEQKRNMEIAESILSKRPVLHVDNVVAERVHPSKSKGGRNTTSKSKSATKPKSGQMRRKGGKIMGGRKRR